MTTRKAVLDESTAKQNAEVIADTLANGGKLVICIHSTSRSNMSYKYTIKLVGVGKNGEVSESWLNYWYAAEWNETLADDYLKGNGCGTNRYFLAAYKIGLILTRRGLINSPYDVASKRIEL